MNISVIIPAYNAEQFISRAVDSATNFCETKEILIVEDGSNDRTLDVCLQLQSKNKKIRVIRHPDGKNHGASASRNLGIHHAAEEFIAFLDADDFYLPNRFAIDRKLFAEFPEIDGIYGAIGTHYETPAAREKFLRARVRERTTISAPIEPEQLLYVLLGISKQASGHFSLDALTVRKSLFAKSGLFDPDLDLSQDTDLIIRMATVGRLMAGSIVEPVAMRGAHDANRVTNIAKLNQARMGLYKKLYGWGLHHDMPESALLECRKKYLKWTTHSLGFLPALAFFLQLRKSNPEVWNDPNAFRIAIFGVFGKSLFSRVILKIQFMLLRRN